MEHRDWLRCTGPPRTSSLTSVPARWMAPHQGDAARHRGRLRRRRPLPVPHNVPGRERDELLANLYARPPDGPPAADHAEGQDAALSECLGSYFSLQLETMVESPPAGPVTTLVDLSPESGVFLRDRSLAELLRPAYLATKPSTKP